MTENVCHITDRDNKESICDKGLVPMSQTDDMKITNEARKEGEKMLEEERPPKFPKRENTVFVFPPSECNDPPLTTGLNGTKLTIDPDKADDDCECFHANFDTFTNVSSEARLEATSDDMSFVNGGFDSHKERARSFAEEYWFDAEKCGNLKECVDDVEPDSRMEKERRRNTEIACSCSIPAEAINECN